MSIKSEKEILARLENHERRIRAFENNKSGPNTQVAELDGSKKALTLAEMIRGKNFKSGQEKVATIVGYYEKIIRKSPIPKIDLKEGWKNGKFDGKYADTLLVRAIKDGLVRDIDNNFDLSQTGEKFFDNFLKSNVRNNQAKTEK